MCRRLNPTLASRLDMELADSPSDITYFNAKRAKEMIERVTLQLPEVEPSLKGYEN